MPLNEETKQELNFPYYVERLLERPQPIIAKEIDRIMTKLMRVQKLYDQGKINPDTFRFIQEG